MFDKTCDQVVTHLMQIERMSRLAGYDGVTSEDDDEQRCEIDNSEKDRDREKEMRAVRRKKKKQVGQRMRR